MYFQTFVAAILLTSGSVFAAPAGNADVLPRQTYIGSVHFITVDGATVNSNMQVGAGYRQLSKATTNLPAFWRSGELILTRTSTAQPGEQQVMKQLVGIEDNLVCSSQSNDGKTTTVTGVQTSDIDPPKQQVLVKCDFINGPPSV
ncbi:MAG: hypothetical protein Q9227_007282 [Pyrenula ochraceoflavens]